MSSAAVSRPVARQHQRECLPLRRTKCSFVSNRRHVILLPSILPTGGDSRPRQSLTVRHNNLHTRDYRIKHGVGTYINFCVYFIHCITLYKQNSGVFNMHIMFDYTYKTHALSVEYYRAVKMARRQAKKLFIQRDYRNGTAVRFSTECPMELRGIVSAFNPWKPNLNRLKPPNASVLAPTMTLA